MGELSKWAQENSPYLKIPDNDSVIVVYKGFKIVEDPRNPGKTKIRYTVELDGMDKWFESASARISMIMDTFLEGDLIEIKKSVENNQVRYEVKAPEKVGKRAGKKDEAG